MEKEIKNLEAEVESLNERIKELEAELIEANEWQKDILKWLDNCPR